MFAYCNNNPVNLADPAGTISTLATVCGVSAMISGLANAISTACTGGSLEECLIAGLCGAFGGAIGAFVGYVGPIDPLRKAVVGRGIATVITDLATSRALNGEITMEDAIWTAVDTTMDMTFSTVGYFYNPISDAVKQTTVNAAVDAGTDVARILLFTNDSTPNVSNTSASFTTRQGITRQRAQTKIGKLLGIIA